MSRLLDYDELTSRLLGMVDGRLAGSFAIGHLITQMQYLDIAVEDYEQASVNYQRAAHRWDQFTEPIEAAFGASDADPDPLTDPKNVAAFQKELALYSSAGLALNYRTDCAYGAARRVLDRVVTVVHELLPRTRTDLGASHANFRTLLPRRCGDLGVEVPGSLLEQADDLNRRIKTVRDRLTEHLESPMDMRSISVSSDRPHPRLTARRVVRVDADRRPDPMPVEFEPAGQLREAIHAYVTVLVELLENARTAGTKPGVTSAERRLEG